MKKLFTERQGMTDPRVKEELDVEQTKGLLTVVNAKIDGNVFGEAFSEECPDGGGNSIGCDLGCLEEKVGGCPRCTERTCEARCEDDGESIEHRPEEQAVSRRKSEIRGESEEGQSRKSGEEGQWRHRTFLKKSKAAI